MMVKGVCINCKKEKELSQSGKSQGYCHMCYKKIFWKPKHIPCLRCKREMPMHAKGFCVGCYNSLFHLEKTKLHNARRRHNIDGELYKRIIKSCNVCGFDKIVEAHHLDHNRLNNSEKNLVGLCPNCHKMLHTKKYQQEIFESLKSKGFEVPRGYDFDGFFKK